MSENLIPLFTSHPSWYVSGGSETVSGDCTITANSDGSFTLNGTTGSTDTTFNLLRIASGMSDLHLNNGTYEYYVKMPMNHHVTEIGPTVDSYSASTGSLVHVVSLGSKNSNVAFPKKFFDITSEHTGEIEISFTLPASTSYDQLTFSLYLGEKSGVDTIADLETVAPSEDNLFRYLTGHPDWNVQGGQATIGSSCTVTVNDNGSITLNGIIDQDSSDPFLVGAEINGGDNSVDLKLRSREYAFVLETNQPNNLNDLEAYLHVSSAQVYSGEHFDPNPGETSGAIGCYLIISFAAGTTFDNLVLRPYVYALEDYENLIPLFPGDPPWYSYRGTASLSDTIGAETLDDSSIVLQGDNGNEFTVPSVALLRKSGTSQTDLHLALGTYKFFIREFDRKKWSTYTGYDDGTINATLYSFSSDGSGTLVELCQNYSSFEITSSVTGDVFVLVDFSEYTPYYYNGPGGSSYKAYKRFEPVICDNSYQFPTETGNNGSNDDPTNPSDPNDEQTPVITVHPQSVSVLAGNAAVFSVSASGSNLSYSWEVSTDNGASWTQLGWTTSSISFTAALSQNGYQYHCVVTENGNSTTSNSATLFVTSGSGDNGNDNPSGNNQGNTSPIVNPGDSTNVHVELSSLYTGTHSYTFPEDYFSSGKIYWRVRSYDSDGNPGGWSDSVSFICYGISKLKNLQCDGKPFATISWTANGQVSYEIKIDNSIGYGPFYGTDSIFVLPEPLADGRHIASVKVQNKLGLETPWSEIEFDVLNIPTDDTSSKLTVNADVDALLWWTPLSVREEDEFLVYRDEKLIRRFNSSVTSFSDRVVLGYHTYKVIQHLPSGYYNLYTHPEVFLSTDTTKIGLLSGGPWLNLILTTERYPTNTFKQTRIVERTRVMGSKYPVVEVSDFEESSATYEVVWPFERREAAYQFKKLLGEAVIVKSRGEQVMVGVLDGYELPVNSQTVGYSFTIEQMDFDDDPSIIISPNIAFGYTDLDRIAFGLMNKTDLESASTNPGTSNPQYYEQIAEAINELKRQISVHYGEGTTNG